MITLKESKPIAKKEHQCDWCYGTIKKGEVYERQSNVADGDFYEWKNHLKCRQIAKALDMWDWVGPEYGLDADSFQESINEEYRSLAPGSDDTSFQDRLDFVINHHKIKQS